MSTPAAESQLNDVMVPRRNRPGARRDQLFSWATPDAVDSSAPFGAQEFIESHIRRDAADVPAVCSQPAGVEGMLWLFEHLRLIAANLNTLSVMLEGECTPATCATMKTVGDCQFLCAAHKVPKECPAIDYINHTLDGTCALLNNQRCFPSRVTIEPSAEQYFSSIARRLYRVFSHAYHHHRRVYDAFESQTKLCSRFFHLVEAHKLMPASAFDMPRPE